MRTGGRAGARCSGAGMGAGGMTKCSGPRLGLTIVPVPAAAAAAAAFATGASGARQAIGGGIGDRRRARMRSRACSL